MAKSSRVLVEIARRRARPGSGSSQALLARRTAELDWPRVDLDLAPVHCAVVGAVATRSYMPERRTADLDIVIRKSDSAAAYDRLARAAYERLGDLSIGGTVWRSPAGPEVDVIEGAEPWWDDAVRKAQGNRDPAGLPVAPLAYLVLMKLRASRAQDLADVSRMMGSADDYLIEETLVAVGRYSPKDVDDLRSLIELGRMEYESD